MMNDGKLEEQKLRKRKIVASEITGLLSSHNKLMKLQNPAVILEDCKHMLLPNSDASNLCKLQNKDNTQEVSVSRVNRNLLRSKQGIPNKSPADSSPAHHMPVHSIDNDVLIPLKTSSVVLPADKTLQISKNADINQKYLPNSTIVTTSSIWIPPKIATRIIHQPSDNSQSSNISTAAVTKIKNELVTSVSSTVSTLNKTPKVTQPMASATLNKTLEVTQPKISAHHEGSGMQTVKTNLNVMNQTKPAVIPILKNSSNPTVLKKAQYKMNLSSILPQATTVCNAMKQYSSNMRRSYKMSDNNKKNHSSNITNLHKGGLGYTTVIGTKEKKRVLEAPHSLEAERDGITLTLNWMFADDDSDIDGFVIMESKDGTTWAPCKNVGRSVRNTSLVYFLNKEQNNWHIAICSYQENQVSQRATFYLGDLSHPQTTSSDEVRAKSLDLTGKIYKTHACYSYDKDVYTYHCHTGKGYDNRASNNRGVASSSSGTTLTPSAFYNILCSPVYCSPLPLKEKNKRDAQIINYQFSIDQTLSSIILASREKLFDNDKYRVIVRICEMKNSYEPKEDKIPDCIISVNARIVLIQMISKVRGSLDITDKCKFNKYCSSLNGLKIEWMPDDKRYCMTISIVEMLDTQGVLSKLMQHIQPAFITAKMVKRELQSCNGLDISSTSMKTQLICPLGKSRLVTPCRGSLCKHVYCMDALTLLKLNEARPLSKKKCFMCDQPLEYMYVDGFFLEILQTVPETVNEVDFQQDGSWSFTPPPVDNGNNGEKRVFLEAKGFDLPVRIKQDDSESSTMLDNKDEPESLLTTQLEKVKLQLARLSNLDKNQTADDSGDKVATDTSVDIADNTENVDIIDLTEEIVTADSLDKDDKSGILDSLTDELPDVVPTTDRSECKQVINDEEVNSFTKKKTMLKSHTPDKNYESVKQAEDKGKSLSVLGLESNEVSVHGTAEAFGEKRDDPGSMKDDDVEIVSVSFKKQKPRNETTSGSDSLLKQRVEKEILRLLKQTKTSEKGALFHEDIQDKNAMPYDGDTSVSVSKQATKRKRAYPTKAETEKNADKNKISKMTLRRLCHLLNESKNSGPGQNSKNESDNDTNTNTDNVTNKKRHGEQQVHVGNSNSSVVKQTLPEESPENVTTSVIRRSPRVKRKSKAADHIGDTKVLDEEKDSANLVDKVTNHQDSELRLQSKDGSEKTVDREESERKRNEEKMQLGKDENLEVHEMNTETKINDMKTKSRSCKQVKPATKESGIDDAKEGCLTDDLANCNHVVTSEVGSNVKKTQVIKKSARLIEKNAAKKDIIESRENQSMINKIIVNNETLSNIQTKNPGKEIERETDDPHAQDNIPTTSYTKRRSKQNVTSVEINSDSSEDQLDQSTETTVMESETLNSAVSEVDCSDIEVPTSSNNICESHQACSSSPSDMLVSQSSDDESFIIQGTGDKNPVLVNYEKYKAKRHLSSEKKRKSLPAIVPFIVDCNETEEVFVVSDSTKYQGKRLSKSFSGSENTTNCVPYIVDCCNADSTEHSELTETVDKFESVVESIETFVSPSKSPCKRVSSSPNIQSDKSPKYFAKGKTNNSNKFKQSPKSTKSQLNKSGKNLFVDSHIGSESDTVKRVQGETIESANDLKTADVNNEEDEDIYDESDFHVEDLNEAEAAGNVAKRQYRVRPKSFKLDLRTCLSPETTFHNQVITSGFPYKRSKPKLAPTTKKRMKLVESGLWFDRDKLTSKRHINHTFWNVSGRQLLSTKLKQMFTTRLPKSSRTTVAAQGRPASRQSSVESVHSDSVENEVGIENEVRDVKENSVPVTENEAPSEPAVKTNAVNDEIQPFIENE